MYLSFGAVDFDEDEEDELPEQLAALDDAFNEDGSSSSEGSAEIEIEDLLDEQDPSGHMEVVQSTKDCSWIITDSADEAEHPTAAATSSKQQQPGAGSGSSSTKLALESATPVLVDSDNEKDDITSDPPKVSAPSLSHRQQLLSQVAYIQNTLAANSSSSSSNELEPYTSDLILKISEL